jgi:glycosyltransferase involved in cell wall biosynthesis
MPGPHCLVFEPDAAGHRLQHVRHICDALLQLGCRVSVALEAGVRERAEYKVHLADVEPHVELHTNLDPRQGKNLRARFRRVTELRDAITQLSPDRAYYPYADIVTPLATVHSLAFGGGPLGRTPVEVQLMRGKYAYENRSAGERLAGDVQKWLLLRNPWQVVHMLDPWSLAGLHPPASDLRFRLIPEPVEERASIDRHDARRQLGIPVEGRYVAMVGAMEPRKGIEELLAAVGRAKLDEGDRVLLVGRMTAPIRELIQKQYDTLVRQQRIVTVDRYVTDEELGAAFFAADIVAVTHPRQIGSSGTLVRAAAADRILLTSDFGWVGWATKLFELGISTDVSDATGLARALETALAQSATYHRKEAGERFCQFHTVANQKAHWVRELGDKHGVALGDLAARVEWDWVTAAVRPELAAAARG